MQSLREKLTLVLIALLPLHALLVTVFTKLFSGAGNRPLGILALWKEALLGVILCLAIREIYLHSKTESKLKLLELKSDDDPSWNPRTWNLDWFDKLILALIILSVPVSLLAHGDFKLYLLGFKYDFAPLVAFLILRRVPWSDWFKDTALEVVLWLGGIVAGYGILSLVLPMGFFTWLGYSDLHSLYMPSGPLAAFQQIGDMGIRRVQSTFSGPNQFGLWLLIPWGLGISMFFRCWLNQPSLLLRFKDDSNDAQRCWKPSLYCTLIGVGILISFSRSAWIAAAAMSIYLTIASLPKDIRHQHLVRMSALLVFGFLIMLLISPQAVVRISSTRDHAIKTWQGISSMISRPLGQGLGTVGPASNHVSDACVHLAAGSDPSWAKDRPNLCVFVGNEQVQPRGKVCQCARVTENWFVQIGVELGLLGFVLFLALTAIVIRKLENASPYFLPFLSISIACLFLHAWESAAVAYTLWVLVATALKAE